jgi:cell division protein ZapA
MTIEINGTTIEVLGKVFQLKCPSDEVPALQKAAVYLEKKMLEIREAHHVLSIDRLAILAALNMSHQLLGAEQEAIIASQNTQARLIDLDNKLNAVLSCRQVVES